MNHTVDVRGKQTRGAWRLRLSVLLLMACLLPPAGAQVSGGRLPTRWDKDVSPTSPRPEYPRPQMERPQWQSLNGPWDYAISGIAATDLLIGYTGKILVPYPYEAALSGVGKASIPDKRLWYRRTFSVPGEWRTGGQRVLLHFGAVNWASTVAVNGRQVGTHRGGYDGFTFDVTDSLVPGRNELVVSAWNPISADNPNAQVIGKQRLRPGGIFYTGATGIWQTVWLEPVPAAHITSLKLTPDVDAKVLRVTVQADGAPGARVQLTATDGAKKVSAVSGAAGTELVLPIKSPRLWTPDAPHLYALRVSLAGRNGDTVDSYFAMRKVSLGKDAQGRTRPFLNNKFVFQVGALDQGYWPDGIYTAPTDEALRYDIETAKELGFNLLRKHAKVEPDRWYYWADRLGMLVWQDMPQAFGDNFSDETKAQWETEWRREIAGFYNHPCIIVWTTFNEGMGQHDTEKIVALTKQLDPTRLVNNASGWVDKGVGDFHDTHAYPGPWSNKPEPTRAAVNGEFGGITMNVGGHRWNNDVMGYGAVLQNGWLVAKRYQKLLQTGYRLKDEQGTSALVYTQITDVEQEINGLLTYDRAVLKVDPVIVAAANRGRFLPLPPNPHPDLLPTSDDEGQTWRYTTDAPPNDWTQTAFNDSAWKSGPAPFGHDAGGARTPWAGTDIWLRREVTLPANLPANLSLLIRHDDEAEVYVNGIPAGAVKGYTDDYIPVPMTAAGRAALKPGKNLLAVHCHQTVGGQIIDVGITETARP